MSICCTSHRFVAVCPGAAGHVQCPRTLTSHDVSCIADRQMCDGVRDCDGGEDEDHVMCLLYDVASTPMFC